MSRFTKTASSFLAGVLAAAFAGAHAPDPTTEIGFEPADAYTIGELDTVGIFNGNLSLVVPIGPSYPVGPALSFQLNLVYNSKIWHFEYECAGGTFFGARMHETPSTCRTNAQPSRWTSNAGAGWLLTLGELVDRAAEQNDMGFFYLSPDGARHVFFPTLHQTGDPASATTEICDPLAMSAGEVCYSRGSDYLRFTKVSGTVRTIESADGLVHTFREQQPRHWRLTRLEDPFGNAISVSYDLAARTWTVADTHGRQHVVRFDVDPSDSERWILASVELEESGLKPSVFTFTRQPASLLVGQDIPGGCSRDASEPVVPGFHTQLGYDLPLLTGIAHDTENWPFAFTYHGITNESTQIGTTILPGSTQCSTYAGQLASMTLPTNGRIEWSYGGYFSPTEVACPTGNVRGKDLLSNLGHSWGVSERRTYEPGASLPSGVWTYRHGLRDPEPPLDAPLFLEIPSGACPRTPAALIRSVYTPLYAMEAPLAGRQVTRTDHYFSVFAQGQGTGWDATEWGSPFSREEEVTANGKTYYLSKKVYQCEEGPRTRPLDMCTHLRSQYVRYERSFTTCHPANDQHGNCFDMNARLAGEVTVYEDADNDSWVDREQFDGLGNYRVAVTGGSIPDTPQRTMTTTYNPGQAAYVLGVGSWSPPASTDPWILGTYDAVSVAEAGNTAYSQFCFDTDTGFLRGTRTLAGAMPADHDLVTTFEPDGQGFVMRERTYGGDGLGNADSFNNTAALCSPLPGQEEYRVDHTYAAGVLQSSTAMRGALPVVSLADLSIDTSTGRVTASRDAAGLETTYQYDLLGRLTRITPAAGAETIVLYGADGDRRKVTVEGKDGGVVLTRAEYRYDGFGRLEETRIDMPGGAVSRRTTAYLPTGLVRAESEPTFGASPSRFTRFVDFDPFGRAARVELPENAPGSSFRIKSFLYSGNFEVNRKETVRVFPDAHIFATTTETSDGLGRLRKVREPSDPNVIDQPICTEYDYDVGDRLVAVRSHDRCCDPGDPTCQPNVTQPNITQHRCFVYDNRGFLLSESHPELGRTVACGTSDPASTITYEYDSRGNRLEKRFAAGGAPSFFDLSYRYDAAGRLTQVLHAGGDGRPLKTFAYGRGDGAGRGNGMPPHDEGHLLTAQRRNLVPSALENDDVVVTETYAYDDPTGRVSARSVRTSDGRLFDLGYEYDALGNISKVVYPECAYPSDCAVEAPPRSVELGYEDGLLTSVAGWASSIAYHPTGAWKTVTHASGATADTVLSRQDLYLASVGLPGQFFTQGLEPLDWFSGLYAYDPARNITKIGDDDYFYDQVSRLARAEVDTVETSPTQVDRTYTYDVFGNLLDLDDSGPAARPGAIDSRTNRLVENAQIVYDDAGNLARWLDADRVFDPFNLVTRQTGSGLDLGMLYTADDERLAVRKATSGPTGFDETLSLRGLDNKVLRRMFVSDGAFAWDRDYVYRSGALLGTAFKKPSGGEGIRHFHLDHLGSIRAVSKPTASGWQRAKLDKFFPFGEHVPGSSTGTKEVMRFTGHERDFNSADDPGTAIDDMDYMHARYYSPWMGRFLSMDPVLGQAEVPQSWNRAAYVRGNPLRMIDPDGRAPDEIKSVGDVQKVDGAFFQKVEITRGGESFTRLIRLELTDVQATQAALQFTQELRDQGYHPILPRLGFDNALKIVTRVDDFSRSNAFMQELGKKPNAVSRLERILAAVRTFLPFAPDDAQTVASGIFENEDAAARFLELWAEYQAAIERANAEDEDKSAQ